MTETLAERAERLTVVRKASGVGMGTRNPADYVVSISVQDCMDAAAILRELAAANAALATERNDALAAVTTAEQRAANAEAALETMTRERDEARKEAAGYDTMLHAACDQRDALAAEVAALRDGVMREAKNTCEGWCADGGQGHFDDCFGCTLAAIATGKERAQ